VDNSSNNVPDKARWRFDPNTGQPISDDTPAPPPQPTQPQTPPDTFRVDPQGASPQYPPQPQYQPPPPAQPTQPTPQYGYQQPQPQPPTQPMPQYAYPPQAPVAAQSTQAVVAKRRSRAPLVIGIVVILLAALGIGGYFLYQNVFNPPAVSVERLLPTNTLGYFSFDPAPSGAQKAAMDKINEAFTSQPGYKEAVANITQSLTGLMGVSPGTEATPQVSDLDTLSSYLGNSVTVAILPPSTDDLNKLKDATNSGNIDTVGSDILARNVVGIVDLDFNPLNKKGPITDLKQNADNVSKATLVEKYRDIEIRKFVTNTTEIYFTLLNGTSTAVVGVKPEPLHTVIDQFKDNKSLKDDPTFKALSGQVPADRIATLYVNLTDIFQQAKLIAPELLQNDSAVQNANGATLITLSAANDGVQIDVASEADLSLMNSGVQINPDARPDESSLRDIPADSQGFLAGTDLQTSIKAVIDSMRKEQSSATATPLPDEFGNVSGPNVDQTLSDFKQQYGVDLENDVLPLLTGDYSLSFSAANKNGTPAFSGVFQLKLKDSAKAISLLDKIASSDAAKDSTQKLSEAGGTFYTSSDGSTGALAGVTQDRFLFVFDSTTLDAAKTRLNDVVNNFGKGLATTADWATRKAHLPNGSNTIIYVDIKSLREFAESTMSDTDKQDYEKNFAPFARPFQYLLIGSATQATKDGNLSRNHTVLFVGISK
jgi:hypothetical protein